jgi:homoserine acetyltransferase
MTAYGEIPMAAVKGVVWAAGRSLPDMSLAFALLAAINGSTDSCATLSHGLSLPHQASPASARRPRSFSSLMGGGARAARDAVG